MPTDSANRSDIRQRLGLRPIINVSGTMTALGASIVVPEAVRAAADIFPEFVEITDLQRKASAAIARAPGAEAGFVTACASAGITLSVAGCMTGADLGRIEPGAIGGMVRLGALAGDPGVRRDWAGLAEAAGLVATPLVRQQATLGGNLLVETRCYYFNQSRDWRASKGYCMKADGDVCLVVHERRIRGRA